MGEDEHNEGSAELTPRGLEEVSRRLSEIRERKRGAVRWRLSTHTAELALRALAPNRDRPRSRSSKTRRRKRTKRLL